MATEKQKRAVYFKLLQQKELVQHNITNKVYSIGDYAKEEGIAYGAMRSILQEIGIVIPDRKKKEDAEEQEVRIQELAGRVEILERELVELRAAFTAKELNLL